MIYSLNFIRTQTKIKTEEKVQSEKRERGMMNDEEI